MRNPLRVRFVRDVALLSGTQATQAAAAMVAGILVARVLGPEGRGTLSVLVAIGSMAVLLASLGVHMSGVYFLGRFKSDRDTVISNNLLVGVVGGVLTALVLSVIVVLFHDQLLHGIELSFFFLYLLVIPCNYFNEFARRVALGLGRVGIFNLPELVGGAGLLVGTATALLVFGDSIGPLIVLRIAIEGVTSVALIILIRRAVHFHLRPSAKLFRKQINYGVRNYASSLMWVFLLQSDLVLVNHFLGQAEAGVYSVAVSLGLPVTLLAGAVGALTFQRVSAEDSRPARIESTNRVLRLLAPLVFVCMLVMGALAEPLVRVVYGHDFTDAALALILLLPGLFALTLETVIMNFLAGEGSPPVVFLAPLAGLLVNFFANLLVIPRWGINGASVTSSVGYTLVFFIVLVYYVRSTGSRTRDVLRLEREDLRELWRASATGPAGAVKAEAT